MLNYEEILAEAVRIEREEHTGRVFIVFEITSPSFKKTVIEDWTKDIEYKLIEKKLIRNE